MRFVKHIATHIDQDGFCIIRDFLSPAVVSQLLGRLDSIAPDARSARVRRGVTFARRNLIDADALRSLVAEANIRALVHIISPGSTAVRAILFDKTGEANWTVPWHQDRCIAVRQRLEVPGFGPWSVKAGIQHVQPPLNILQQMLTLRFHLDPCGEDNGPLRVIPKTHMRILNPVEIETRAATASQVACTTDAGGLLLMRPLLLHASSPAKVVSHRRVLHVEFGPAALPGDMQWATSA